MSVPFLIIVMVCYGLTAYDFYMNGNAPMGWIFATYAAGIPGFIMVAK